MGDPTSGGRPVTGLRWRIRPGDVVRVHPVAAKAVQSVGWARVARLGRWYVHVVDNWSGVSHRLAASEVGLPDKDVGGVLPVVLPSHIYDVTLRTWWDGSVYMGRAVVRDEYGRRRQATRAHHGPPDSQCTAMCIVDDLVEVLFPGRVVFGVERHHCRDEDAVTYWFVDFGGRSEAGAAP